MVVVALVKTYKQLLQIGAGVVREAKTDLKHSRSLKLGGYMADMITVLGIRKRWGFQD
jgi:hypothetical protein